MRLPNRTINDMQDVKMFLQELGTALLQLPSLGVPAGTLLCGAWNPENVPNGYVLCDGRNNLGTAEFPELFKIVGFRYGGDGTTRFAVPDMRSRVVVGYNADPMDDDRHGTYGTYGKTGTQNTSYNGTWIIKV